MIHYEFHTFSPIAQNRQRIFYLLFFAVRALNYVDTPTTYSYYFYIHTVLTGTASARLAVLSGSSSSRATIDPFSVQSDFVRQYPSRVPLPTAAIAMSSTESRVIAIAVIVVVTLVCAARYGSAAATAARSH